MTKLLLSKALKHAFNRGGSSKLLVFTFHDVTDSADERDYAQDVNEFETQVRWITQHFKVETLSAAVDKCRANEIDEPTACITFDDGYKSHLSLASPILLQYEATGTFFVSSGQLGRHVLWNDAIFYSLDRRPDLQGPVSHYLHEHYGIALPKRFDSQADFIGKVSQAVKYQTLSARYRFLNWLKTESGVKQLPELMLTEEEIQTLDKKGHCVGSHTRNHPILAVEPQPSFESEIESDLQNLERILQKPITSFAYPNGKPGKDYTEAQINCLRSNNIQYACSTAPGHFIAAGDTLQIPRIGLKGTNPLGFIRTALSALNTPGDILEIQGYQQYR